MQLYCQSSMNKISASFRQKKFVLMEMLNAVCAYHVIATDIKSSSRTVGTKFQLETGGMDDGSKMFVYGRNQLFSLVAR